MKHALLALALMAAAMALWYVERDREVYTPVVRVRSADGLYITLLHARTTRRSQCAAMLGRFEAALRSTCPRCAVESAACATELDGMDRALAGGEPVPVYTVSAEGIRAGLLGPPASVRRECESMARQFLRSGAQRASCIAPSAGPG